MNALDSLAVRCGIELSFKDARGEIRESSVETRRALLCAMGVAAHDEAAAHRALDDIDRLEWTRVLPPACVLRSSEPLAVPVVLPAGTKSLAWRLVLEDGSARSGEERFEMLELLRRHEIDGICRECRKLALPDVAQGYHRLSIEPGGGGAVLIVTPGACWLPDVLAAGGRVWGVAAQLYLLRSAGNWGIGDYADLRRLIDTLQPLGADVVGLNPLHAMFLDDPEHASPYSPASRLLLNALNIDVAGLPELAACEAARTLLESRRFKHALKRCRDAPLVSYQAVADLKLQALRLIFDSSARQTAAPRWQAFEAFRREAGETLERGCVFQALRRHFAVTGQADWHDWPEQYRDPQSSAVTAFALEHAALVTFHGWLQFLADTQLCAAAEAAAPMVVGLYRDLAVGADRSGAETWADQSAVVDGAQVGAPPDIYNPAGQDWGLPPFNPRALKEQAYRSFIDLVRANMRHAGGLRIDHVMGLQQLYWVPRGKSPGEGAYVRYPRDDLVGILALESSRQRCLVVGEDLGTVPDGFRERMAEAHILSYRVLLFEKDAQGFLPPERYPALALAVTGSHDLPTLRGWWKAGDLKLKQELGLFPTTADRRQAWQERATDRKELRQALRRAGVAGTDDLTVESLMLAAHAFLARTRSALALAQLDDLTDEASPVNVPCTSHEHPNWRRRLSLTLEQLAEHPRLAAVAGIFRAERGV